MRMTAIRERLQESLQPVALQLGDESHLHAGHAGAKEGRGHYRLHIVTEKFAGLRPLARHQLVYAALGDLMQTDIHALTIQAFTPAENLKQAQGS